MNKVLIFVLGTFAFFPDFPAQAMAQGKVLVEIVQTAQSAVNQIGH